MCAIFLLLKRTMKVKLLSSYSELKWIFINLNKMALKVTLLFSGHTRTWTINYIALHWNHEIKRWLLFGRKFMTNLDSILKSRDITLSRKVRLVKAMVFPVVTYGCESWIIKKAECQRIDALTVVLERTLESPLDCKQIKPVHPKGDQSWVFIRRTDFEDEMPILWPLDAKSWLIGKDLDVGKDWRQEKGTTEDEMVRWHHRLNGHGVRWTPGVGDGQGGLSSYSPWGR